MNSRFTLALCVVLFAAVITEAQVAVRARTWIMFRDKGAITAADPASLGINERALRRRAKVLPAGHLTDELDLPVASAYLDQLRATGVTIHSISRWLNAASVEGPADRVAALASLPFVRAVQSVATATRRREETASGGARSALMKTSASGIAYGQSTAQNTRAKVIDVHNLGITGQGILLGMQDDGFNYHTTHVAIKHLPVVAEYDFVQRDNNTSVAPGEYASQGEHGRECLSIAAGFANGTLSGGQSLIGPAFGASVALAKTEVDSVEVHAEEDNYVEALEWMERLGADVVSTSLGYDNFDPSGYNADDIFYWKKDGRTAKTSKAAAIAARKGVLLVTAMGNENWYRTDSTWSITLTGQTGSIVTPADADSIISVGAVSSAGLLTSFSSTGPTADGRTKPEVVHQGSAVYFAYGSTNASGSGSGTSFATPLTAGAAVLVLSAHPELTPMQVREALMNTTLRDITDSRMGSLPYPNNYYGWGHVNALAAALYWGPVFSNRPEVGVNESAFLVSTFLKSNTALQADSLFLYYKKSGSSTFQRVKMTATPTADKFQAAVPLASIDSAAVGYISTYDNAGKLWKSPFNAPDSTFVLRPTFRTTGVEDGPRPVLPSTVTLESYPNPFNPSCMIRVDAPAAGDADLSIFNTLGQQIATLHHGFLPAGEQQFRWNGTDHANVPVAAGMYIARLRTASTVTSVKMLYLR